MLKALSCSNDDRPPVWLMRQAGRYLPEYRALRERYSFMQMCHDPELIVQITQMPIKRFGFDAAILFSDILVILEAFNRVVRFEEGVGPIIENPVRHAAEVAGLSMSGLEERLAFVFEGIRRLRHELTIPLIGFCGGPFTVSSYLIEGGSNRELTRTKRWMYEDPTSFHALLDKITEASISYLQLQVASGIQVIQIFDSWAHVLAHRQFREYSLAYMSKMVSALKPSGVPIILFCRGSSVFAEQLAELKPACISLDWNSDLRNVRRRIGPGIALQGNLDPEILFAPVNVVEREVNALLDSMEEDPGFIFNLGHGILPQTPLESVQALVDSVRSRSLVG